MKYKVRIVLTVVLTVLAYIVNAVLTSAQTPLLNHLAVMQVEDSDAAYIAAHTGMGVLSNITWSVLAAYVLVLLAIWLPVLLRKKRDDQ